MGIVRKGDTLLRECINTLTSKYHSLTLLVFSRFLKWETLKCDLYLL